MFQMSSEKIHDTRNSSNVRQVFARTTKKVVHGKTLWNTIQDRIRRSQNLHTFMLLSLCGEYPCECKHLIFAANSPEMIRLTRIITETSEALQMVTNACEFLTNPCEFLTKLTIQLFGC